MIDTPHAGVEVLPLGWWALLPGGASWARLDGVGIAEGVDGVSLAEGVSWWWPATLAGPP